MFASKQFSRTFSNDDYIFIDYQTGELMPRSHPDSVIRTVTSYLKKTYNLDFAKISPHYFRHTFASKGLREGVSLETLKELLGHSDYTMISRIYAHSSTEDKEKAISAMFSPKKVLGSNCGQKDEMPKFDHN